MRGCARNALVALLLFVGTSAASVRAQRIVQFAGRGEPVLDERIRGFLAGPYLLITKDTVIRQGQTVPGNVLIVGSTASIDGTVQGTLLDINANVFVRPAARITGDVVNLGGGLYRSELSKADGSILNRPLAPYHADIRGDTVFIRGLARNPATFAFTPEIPTYDRVNGVALRLGAALRLPIVGSFEPEVRGKASFRTAGSTFDGGVELALIRRNTLLDVGVDRDVLTNDAWIRSDNPNTLSFLFGGKDYRNYYGADRIYAELKQDFHTSSSLVWGLSLRAQRERARSLDAHDPWVFLNRHFRENPPINPGVVASLTLGTHAAWSGPSWALQTEANAEVAGKTAGGDFAFNRYIFAAEFAGETFANHAVDITVHAQGPLPGTDSLPLQRWSFTGGSPVLYTFPLGFFRGDRVVAVKTEYLIPGNRRLRLPLMGVPDLTFIHTAAMAWTQRNRPRFEQNLGAQIQFFVLYARFIVNPSPATPGGKKQEFSFGVKLPGSHRPWDKLAESGRRPRIRSRF